MITTDKFKVVLGCSIRDLGPSEMKADYGSAGK